MNTRWRVPRRKTAQGYNGFAVHFARTSRWRRTWRGAILTINAMAREVLDHHPNDGQDTLGELIDPYNGQQDLRDQILRHVSPAFIEDPVRILRLARFAARWPRLPSHLKPCN